jgi:hypothetical protein
VILEPVRRPLQQVGDLVVLEDRMIGLVLVKPGGAAATSDQIEPQLLRGGRLAGAREPVD